MKNLSQDKRLLSILFATNNGPLVIHNNINEATGNEKAFLSEKLSRKNIKGYKKYNFHCILNKDQTLRWVFPSTLNTPLHLNFYNQQNLKAKVYALLTKLTFKLRLKRLVATKRFSLYIKDGSELAFKNSATHTNYDNFTVFMGTVGPHRKITVGLTKKNKINHFLKIGTSVYSIASIQKEKKAYDKLVQLNLKSAFTPQAHKTNNVAHLIINNIANASSKRMGTLTKNHIDFQLELYAKSKQLSSLDDEKNYQKHLSIQLEQLRVDNRHENSKLMIEKIKKLYKSLDKNSVITSLSHGDFTPWNMFINKENKLAIYDWEMLKRTPLLFDVFHFIYQNEALTNKGDFKSINEQIKKAFEKPELKAVIKEYNINIDTYHKWYIVENVSYYLNYYAIQEKLHLQVNWLLNIWDSALTHFTANTSSSSNSMRTKFIIELFSKIKNQPYGVLKANGVLPHMFNKNSDIDIVTIKEVSKQTIKWIETSPLLMKVDVIKKSYMHTCKLWFKDDSFLSLDFIHEFKRKNQNFLSAQKMLISSRLVDGVKMVNNRFDFEYIVKFYRLNRAKIPVKYINYFNTLKASEKRSIINHLNIVCGTNFRILKQFNSSESRRQIAALIQQKEPRKNKLKSNVNYIYDLVHGMVNNRGKVITLSGVDGAGKTTILNELVGQLENKYREEVVVLRHRPSILPIISALKYGKKNAEKIAVQNLPRTGKNKNVLSSYLRFSYYLIDYSLGQFYVFFKYSLRGKTIVYDRYYFDFISDPRRSNLTIHPALAKFLYRIVFKPNLNVLLHASSDIILSRKKELTKETIEELTNSYKTLFNKLQKNRTETYLSINNKDKNKTLQTILDAYLKVA